ncbi:MAG: lipid hydroperoxide peroxidase, partial [Muribaculaceae bacterium]|nr:lipid hydroperoxide peroxidase [Muribaculaceae bacterium]
RSPLFAQKYGLQIVDGPLAGLLARAVIISDADGRGEFVDLVSEITNEPDYKAALDFMRNS